MPIRTTSREDYHQRDIDDTKRIAAAEAHAIQIARERNMPVLLLHNSAPGALAACHVHALSQNGFYLAESLRRSHIILVYRNVSELDRALRTIGAAAIKDEDQELAPAVLLFAYGPDGKRLGT